MGKLLSVKQAAEYLGISTWAVRELIWGGKVPYVKLGERKMFLDRADLDSMITKHKQVFD